MEYLQVKQKRSSEGVSSWDISVMLLNALADRLPCIIKEKNCKIWNAQEIANRQCQYLREKGLISYAKRKWTLVKSGNEIQVMEGLTSE